MNALEILAEAKAAALAAVKTEMAKYDNKEPAHMDCGFTWVKMNYNRNRANDETKEFMKQIKAELKRLGFKYRDGNLVRLDGSFVKFRSEAPVEYLGSEDYLPSTWYWWNPAHEICNWQHVYTKHEGSIAFANVLQSYGIQAYASWKFD